MFFKYCIIFGKNFDGELMTQGLFFLEDRLIIFVVEINEKYFFSNWN